MKNMSVAEPGSGDEFGYPLEISAEARFIPPVTLTPAATPADHERHAAAYTAYQERFSQAFRARRRARGKDDEG